VLNNFFIFNQQISENQSIKDEIINIKILLIFSRKTVFLLVKAADFNSCSAFV